jgi:hypothetical protein
MGLHHKSVPPHPHALSGPAPPNYDVALMGGSKSKGEDKTESVSELYIGGGIDYSARGIYIQRLGLGVRQFLGDLNDLTLQC